MSFTPQHIGVTDHALMRFRQRAVGHPSTATFKTVQQSVRNGRKMRPTDIAVIDDELYPVCQKDKFTQYVNDAHRIVHVMESIDIGFRVVTCLPLEWTEAELPKPRGAARPSEKYGDEFVEWWRQNRLIPKDEKLAMDLAGRAWSAGRATLRVSMVDESHGVVFGENCQ